MVLKGGVMRAMQTLDLCAINGLLLTLHWVYDLFEQPSAFPLRHRGEVLIHPASRKDAGELDLGRIQAIKRMPRRYLLLDFVEVCCYICTYTNIYIYIYTHTWQQSWILDENLSISRGVYIYIYAYIYIYIHGAVFWKLKGPAVQPSGSQAAGPWTRALGLAAELRPQRGTGLLPRFASACGEMSVGFVSASPLNRAIGGGRVDFSLREGDSPL